MPAEFDDLLGSGRPRLCRSAPGQISWRDQARQRRGRLAPGVERAFMSESLLQPHAFSRLLQRMGDSRDSEAWRTFVEVYGPLVRHSCRRLGLQDADAAEVAQED